jgi:hypothetical protein
MVESDSQRNRRWLTAYEEGTGMAPDQKRAKWGDLLKTGDHFDIYSFQLVVFSALVAFELLTSNLQELATFTIPPNLLGLLGLSNAVYIGGKAVTAPTIGELDKKVNDLRDAERAWMGKVWRARRIPDLLCRRRRGRADAESRLWGRRDEVQNGAHTGQRPAPVTALGRYQISAAESSPRRPMTWSLASVVKM